MATSFDGLTPVDQLTQPVPNPRLRLSGKLLRQPTGRRCVPRCHAEYQNPIAAEVGHAILRTVGCSRRSVVLPRCTDLVSCRSTQCLTDATRDSVVSRAVPGVPPDTDQPNDTPDLRRPRRPALHRPSARTDGRTRTHAHLQMSDGAWGTVVADSARLRRCSG